MGFDQTLLITVITGLGALSATFVCLVLGRRAKRATQLSAALLLLAVGTFAYGISTVSPSPSTLFTEEFGTLPDATITDLKATRFGGAGNYRTYIQFHAPPTTIQRLFSVSSTQQGDTVIGWDAPSRPEWWLHPNSPGFLEHNDYPKGRQRTGHFGIRFWPDGGRVLRYHPKENLVQCFWGFYE